MKTFDPAACIHRCYGYAMLGRNTATFARKRIVWEEGLGDGLNLENIFSRGGDTLDRFWATAGNETQWKRPR